DYHCQSYDSSTWIF
nr:immunoglobulin light chain junction region [Macaca mulatta]MOX12493.1 immunoglobulin light chain junction region [Macaca mulatta]